MATHWVDVFRFEPLVEELTALDRELDQLEGMLASAPDALLMLEDMDALVGEGFLRIQLYMIERKGEPEAKVAYDCGPRHNSHFFADILNMAGSYRKHRAEWPSHQSAWKPAQRRTAHVFRDAGVCETEFWLLHLLHHLTKPEPARLLSLLPRLIAWRDAFDLQCSGSPVIPSCRVDGR